jgi:hypothetical protein
MARRSSKNSKSKKRWLRTVKTDSTHPPRGLFAKSAGTIAKTLASRRVSPKGPQSGLRMLSYFMNRAGSNLSRSRRAELKKAKSIISGRLKKQRSRKRRARRRR